MKPETLARRSADRDYNEAWVDDDNPHNTGSFAWYEWRLQHDPTSQALIERMKVRVQQLQCEERERRHAADTKELCRRKCR